MIRVVYQWQVESNNFKDFKKTWRETTNRIHETVPGALGSFMLQANEDKSKILTIAKWDTIESWKKFWGNTNPKKMEIMRKLGKRVSVETYDEIDDYTR